MEFFGYWTNSMSGPGFQVCIVGIFQILALSILTLVILYVELYILWTVHRDAHTWDRTTRCTLFKV